jgi:hypothetical protein
MVNYGVRWRYMYRLIKMIDTNHITCSTDSVHQVLSASTWCPGSFTAWPSPVNTPSPTSSHTSMA